MLSGMAIPALVAGIVIPLGFFSEVFRQHFNLPLTPQLLQLLLVSILLMVLHKGESFFSKEYDECPVYKTADNAPWTQNSCKAIFISFVGTFLGMLFLLYLAMLGPPWPLILFCIWLSQGLHEMHHAAKSLARKKIYPGLFTSLLFVALQSFWMFPTWHDVVFETRGVFFFVYYALLPLIFVAFFAEDKLWLTKLSSSARPAT